MNRLAAVGGATFLAFAVFICAAPLVHAGAPGPHAGNVVLVIMENRDYGAIVGNRDAPYVNGTLVPRAAVMTNSHAVTHPSRPNYLALFSGSTQGVTSDSCPRRFSGENAGAALLSAGKTFIGYAESMPRDGFTGCWSGKYARKHNPWVDFSNVPASSNRVYRGFPSSPPALAIVVPNLCNDMHDCSTRAGDDWLKANLPPILAYDAAHDGVLILTWDEAEPDRGTNRIPTLLVGPGVKPGRYGQRITHYSVLHTIESVANTRCTGAACQAPVIGEIWR